MYVISQFVYTRNSIMIGLIYILSHFLIENLSKKHSSTYNKLPKVEKSTWPDRFTSILNTIILLTLGVYGLLYDEESHEDYLRGSSFHSYLTLQFAAGYFFYDFVIVLIHLDLNDRKKIWNYSIPFFIHGFCCFFSYYLAMVKKKKKTTKKKNEKKKKKIIWK